MIRQHAQPIHLSGSGAAPAIPLSLGSGLDQISEAQLQRLLHEYPACLPIREIDPLFADPVPLCMELPTEAGPIDNFMVTETGLPVIVECKLWRNPEGRREVVGQILDYAKELTRWNSSDVQSRVARVLGQSSNTIVNLLREAGRQVDEIAFNDSLTQNLRKGRFLLLIVGDGIREGVEAIAEYLQAHANLHFSLGLVELPIFTLADGSRIVTPRVLVRTHLIERQVVAVPDGLVLQDSLADIESGPSAEDENDPVSRISFWRAFLSGLRLDDPEQVIPRAGRNGFVTMAMPGGTWLSIYRQESRLEVGIYLSYGLDRDSLGARAVDRLLQGWPEIQVELGGTVQVETDSKGRRLIWDTLATGSWAQENERLKAFEWLRKRTNDFVNVLRPKMKSIVADLEREN